MPEKSASQTKNTFITRKIPQLYKHQQDAVETLEKWEKNPINNIKGGILAFKMGLGKTRTMLELIHKQCYDDTDDKPIGPVLVVCNKSNIQVWANDIDKFYPNTLSYFILHSDYCKLDQVSMDDLEDHHIIITTYEVVRAQFAVAQPKCFLVRENNFAPMESGLYSLEGIPAGYKIAAVKKANPKIMKKFNPIYSIGWWKIISDESQKFANPKSKLNYAMISLLADSYFCLSGTPIVNYESDLYSMFRFMGWFGLMKDWNKTLYYALNMDLRVLSKDYSDTDIVLPKMTVKTVRVQLSEEEKRVYNKLVDILATQFALFQKGQATFAAPLAMFTRLRQTCVCPYIMTRESKPASAVKLKELKALQECGVQDATIQDTIDLYERDELLGIPSLDNYIKDQKNIKNYTKMAETVRLVDQIVKGGGKVLIFSSFVTALDQLKKLLKYPSLKLDGKVKTEDRQDMVQEFNKAESIYKIFLSSFKTGGVGLNLTGADHVILLEPWWNTATEEQAICRAHRIGQDKPVTVYNFVAIPSFETYLLEVQRRKNEITKEYLGNHEVKYDRLKNDDSLAKELIKHVINNRSTYYL